MMKLPDNRYSTRAEFCGHETARHVPRFCGEWLSDSALWPDRPGNQAPAFDDENDARAACWQYEHERRRLIADGAAQQARASFYQD